MLDSQKGNVTVCVHYHDECTGLGDTGFDSHDTVDREH